MTLRMRFRSSQDRLGRELETFKSDWRAACRSLSTHLRALASEGRATGEHDELTASIDEATMEVSSNTAPAPQSTRTADRHTGTRCEAKIRRVLCSSSVDFRYARCRSEGAPDDTLKLTCCLDRHTETNILRWTNRDIHTTSNLVSIRMY